MVRYKIQTRKDMHMFIQADRSRQNIPHPFLSWLTFSEDMLTRKYLTVLRHLEYHINRLELFKTNKKEYFGDFASGLLLVPYNLIGGGYYYLKWRRLWIKTGIQIHPNIFGPGLCITHHAFVHVDPPTIVGKNCSLFPMVLFGKNRPGRIEVGDNVKIGTGVTILAPCKIGSNVFIGAGAVVNKDVPDNSVVAGVPAKVIKYLDTTANV